MTRAAPSVFRRPLLPTLSNRSVGDFRSDAALFPNLFGQTCYCCDISALNNSESSVQPLVGCNSSTNDVLIVVTVVMGTLLAVAMTALAVALYKIWQMKDRTASATQ